MRFTDSAIATLYHNRVLSITTKLLKMEELSRT